jgi:predicted Zn-dependent protease
MRGRIPVFLPLLAFPAALPGCETVPITGRRQLRLLSEAEEARLGADAYQEVLSEAALVPSGPDLEAIRRVGGRIAAVSDEPGFAWDFNLIRDDKTVNAFCLPGGKVAFYTGILPITKTEAGIAVVMGHEIGHAIAHHGAERVSHGLVVEGLVVFADATLANQPDRTRNLILEGFGLGAQVGVLLPFSRKHESEADRIGLHLMARAGYDPREAAEFWRRMDAGGGAAPPEWLSTHPSHETRIQDLEAWLPEALREYEEARRTRR